MANKKDAFIKMLNTGVAVHVELDVQYPDVDLPQNLRGKDYLVLAVKLGSVYNEGLYITDSGFSACFRFNGVPYICQVSWESVRAMCYGNNNMGWKWYVPKYRRNIANG